jgi:hypothetical protein
MNASNAGITRFPGPVPMGLRFGGWLAACVLLAGRLALADGFDPFESQPEIPVPTARPASAEKRLPATAETFDPFATQTLPTPLRASAPSRSTAAADNSDLRTRIRVSGVSDGAWPNEPVHSVPLRFPAAAPAEEPTIPIDTASYFPPQPTPDAPVLNAFGPSVEPTRDPAADPCGAPQERPLGQLTIGIQLPSGELPIDRAAACWEQLQSAGGLTAAQRMWPLQTYSWNATCLAHRPLYFEEINLERYGYGCCECLQPFASAAHFFGTVPALPYCLAADCPGECQYTLGHYRPGSCPPRRCHWPPPSALGGLGAAGAWTGLVFLIP